MDEVIAPQDQQTAWNEVAAERAGTTPVKPAPKPAIAPAASPAEPAAEAPEWAARISELEAKLDGRMRKTEGHLGQVIGSQKELKTMLEAGQSAARQVSDAPTQSEVKKATETPAEWAALKAQYPDWALATEKFLDSRQQPAFDAKAFEAGIEARIEGKSKAMAEKIIDSALSVVSPGWKGTVNSTEFQGWLGTQPEDIKTIFNESDDVGEAARVLKMYDAHRQSNPSHAITEQRKNVLAAATSAPKGPQARATAKSVDDMSPKELWDYEAKLRAKAAQR